MGDSARAWASSGREGSSGAHGPVHAESESSASTCAEPAGKVRGGPPSRAYLQRLTTCHTRRVAPSAIWAEAPLLTGSIASSTPGSASAATSGSTCGTVWRLIVLCAAGCFIAAEMRLTSQRLDRTHPDAGFWLELASWLRTSWLRAETGEMSTVDAMSQREDHSSVAKQDRVAGRQRTQASSQSRIRLQAVQRTQGCKGCAKQDRRCVRCRPATPPTTTG